MLPASNRGVGMNIGFPDVCNTPVGPAVVPIPYPNFALNAQAVPFSPIVRCSMVNALNQASTIPMTFGDDPGVAHPTFKGTGRYTMGNPIVHVDKLPAINLLCPTTGNNMNDGVGAVLVPSVTNVFYTYAGVVDALEDALTQPLPGPGRMLDAETGYLAIACFSFDMPTRVGSEIARLQAQGMRSLVLDLRDNPGGELDACVRLADDFLERGLEIVRVVDADGDELVYRARQDDPHRFPLVLWVNRNTASAAEIFVGSLKAHGRATVVGEATYGKGTGQKLLPGEEGALYATVGRCLLPGGVEIDGVGVEPDRA